jgi:hypothetical protein
VCVIVFERERENHLCYFERQERDCHFFTYMRVVLTFVSATHAMPKNRKKNFSRAFIDTQYLSVLLLMFAEQIILSCNLPKMYSLRIALNI